MLHFDLLGSRNISAISWERKEVFFLGAAQHFKQLEKFFQNKVAEEKALYCSLALTNEMAH